MAVAVLLCGAGWCLIGFIIALPSLAFACYFSFLS